MPDSALPFKNLRDLLAKGWSTRNAIVAMVEPLGIAGADVLDAGAPREIWHRLLGDHFDKIEIIAAEAARQHPALSGMIEEMVREERGSRGLPWRGYGPGKLSSTRPTYAVSCLWTDEIRETVERLCREAEAKGIRIMRIDTDLGLGGKISGFMTSLASRDRVFVILSDAYLRSEGCMFELSEIWRLSQQDDDGFHERVRVFLMPDARIRDMDYQIGIIEHWEREQDKLQAQVGKLASNGMLSADLLNRFNNLKTFARQAGKIVQGIADRRLAEDFEEFMLHGLQ